MNQESEIGDLEFQISSNNNPWRMRPHKESFCKAGVQVRVREESGDATVQREGYFKDRQTLELKLVLSSKRAAEMRNDSTSAMLALSRTASLEGPSAALHSAQDDRRKEDQTPFCRPEEAARVEFLVEARCAHGGWSFWRLVESVPTVALDREEIAVAEWSFQDWAQFNRWAFADFRFAALAYPGGQQHEKPLRLVSAPWRHYASCVGIYGFGPIGERFSNSEIRFIAEKIGGVAIQFRQREALRKMAAQVPPSEQNMRLFGYSLGGRAAVGFARWLERRGVSVESLVGIDPVDLAARQIAVPANVRRAISGYQRNGARLPLLAGPAGRGLPFAAADPAKTLVKNWRIDVAPGGWAVMHEDAPRAMSAEVIALLSGG